MPYVDHLLHRESICHRLHEHTTLNLPSEITDTALRSQICSIELITAEDRLREAEANDALEELRRLLRTRTALNQAKVKHVTGQKPNTRARAVQQRMDARVTECKLRYRHSRERLLALRGKGAWETVLRELKDEDVRALNERERNREEKAERERLREMAKLRATEGDVEEGESYGVILQKAVSLGEGRRTLSWIWYTVPVGDGADDPHMNEGEFSCQSCNIVIFF